MPEGQIGAYVVGWEGHGAAWSVWCDDFDWTPVVSVQAYGKPTTDFFATALPTTLNLARHPRAEVDVSQMPVNQEFRFWLEFTLNDNAVIRVPDTYDLLTIR